VAIRGMADDGAGVPLSRRTPGAARRGPGKPVKPVLSDSQLKRMKAAVDAEHGQGDEGGRTDDTNTQPLPRVVVSGPSSESGAKPPLSPSGVGPYPEVVPEPAAKPEAVADPPSPVDEQPWADEQPWPEEQPWAEAQPRAEEQPRPEEYLRAAKALRVVPPELLPAAEQEPLASAALREPLVSAAPPPPAQPAAPADQENWPSIILPGDATEAAPPPPAPPAPEPTPGSIGWLWPDDTPTRGGRRGGGRWMPPGDRRYRTAALAAAGVIILGGAGVIIGLALRSSPAPVASHGKSKPKVTAPPTKKPTVKSPTTPASNPYPALSANIAQAATWAFKQLAPSTVVACDPTMCAALTAHGLHQSQVAQIGAGSLSLAGASVVIVTPALNKIFTTANPSLHSSVVPVALANFGVISVQLVDPAGVPAYRTALEQDVKARVTLGQQLIAGGRVSLSSTAQNELTAGMVDPRVLLALKALANQLPIEVIRFANSGPGANAGAPFRAVVIAASDPASSLTQPEYLTSIGELLKAHATFPAFRHAKGFMMPDGVPGLRISWAAPTPLDLLTP
jgi:hypothetical protein